MLVAWEVMSLGGSGHARRRACARSGWQTACCSCSRCWKWVRLRWSSRFCYSITLGRYRLRRVQCARVAPIASALLRGWPASRCSLASARSWASSLSTSGFRARTASGSGATGVLFSGVVLNAAYFALSRGWNGWLGVANDSGTAFGLGVVAIAIGVVSAVLAILFAFQQDDWRTLLSYSSAENASVAVAMLGVTQLFRSDHLNELAGLAWTVALLHLAGHSLAKGALFLVADGIQASTGNYDIVPRGWIRNSGFMLGLGALFAAMSLASIPPQAGFVSEWYVFQSVFQGFHLSAFTGRLVLVLAGAGLALAAAVALATFVKLFGLGLLGMPDPDYQRPVPRRKCRGRRRAGTLRARGGRRRAVVAQRAGQRGPDAVSGQQSPGNGRRMAAGAADRQVCIYLAVEAHHRDAVAGASSRSGCCGSRERARCGARRSGLAA